MLEQKSLNTKNRGRSKLPPDFRLRLQQELVVRIQRNPKYSLRSFAVFLGLHSGTLSQLLSGKRPIGKRLRRTLGERLGLSPVEIEAYEDRSRRGREDMREEAGETLSAADYRQLSLDAFSVISDWYHFAILELAKLKNFRADPRWIGRRLGITATEARAAFERLSRLDLLVKSEAGWEASFQNLTTLQFPFSSGAHRRLQRQLLEHAIAALESVDIEYRDQTALTVTIPRAKLPELRAKITEFRRGFDQLADSYPEKDEVYQLVISFFPLSKNLEKP